MANIAINGAVRIGNSLMIKGDRLFVDGVDVTPEAKAINIVVHGHIEKLDVNVGLCRYVEMTGDSGSVSTGSGDVRLTGNVNGPVKTEQGDVSVSGMVTGSVKTEQGEITCGNVGGDVETSMGEVTCGNVNGNVKTGMGDISYRK